MGFPAGTALRHPARGVAGVPGGRTTPSCDVTNTVLSHTTGEEVPSPAREPSRQYSHSRSIGPGVRSRRKCRCWTDRAIGPVTAFNPGEEKRSRIVEAIACGKNGKTGAIQSTMKSADSAGPAAFLFERAIINDRYLPFQIWKIMRISRWCRIDRDGCIQCQGRAFRTEPVLNENLAKTWELSRRQCATSMSGRASLHQVRDVQTCANACLEYPADVSSIEPIRILHLNQVNGFQCF